MTPGPQFRRLRKKLRDLLISGDLPRALTMALALPPRRAINPLLALLNEFNPGVKWGSVTLTGAVTAQMAGIQIEDARVVMRRLFWNLSDESGGIGWGAAEALGEIMARNYPLAREYTHLLVARLRPEAGVIDTVEFLHGILWGLGRVAHAHPALVGELPLLLPPFLENRDGSCRALAAWIAAAAPHPDLFLLLQKCLTDPTPVLIFRDNVLQHVLVSTLAAEALNAFAYSRIPTKPSPF